jgi:5-methyltetrahydropteroyltriglutamate--homocysteine methyltransferase
MSASTYRAEVLGSLLQPEQLLEARTALLAGTISAAELHEIEDAAVLDAIEIQESSGVDVISDGEMRRSGWSLTRSFLEGIETSEGRSSYPASVQGFRGGQGGAAGTNAGSFQAVVRKVTPVTDRHPGEEYPFLKAHAHAPTKYTMAAPSYHRRYWSDTVSTGAYGSCEEFLTDIRDWLRGIASWLVDQGCGYIQLDAPNYGSLCDEENRAWHAEQGHDLDAEVAFDAALDSSVFEGLDVIRALHVCRGNGGAGQWHSSGGYGAISGPLFSSLDMDVVLLEYDSDRAGDFAPLAQVKPGTVAVLGLLSTKSADLEDEDQIETRVKEAATIKPLNELALSTQCGFASAANAPMSWDEQRKKLEMVSGIARRVWGPQGN